MALRDLWWLLPGRLAGWSRPGLFDTVENDMRELRDAGFGHVVTLRQRPLEPPPEKFGLRGLHFPIPDMGFPTPRAAERVVDEICGAMAEGEAVLVHCKAGLGRTGVVLACCLVRLGRTPAEAIAEVRRANRRAIQTQGQLSFVGHFAEYLRPEAVEAGEMSGGGLPPLRLKLPGS